MFWFEKVALEGWSGGGGGPLQTANYGLFRHARPKVRFGLIVFVNT